THSIGIKPLRDAVVNHYKKKYGVDISSDQVIVTMGTSPALLMTLCAIINPEDEVILSDPTYACYPNFITYIDGKPISVPVYEEDGFIFHPENIKKKISGKTKAIIINSPSNPTGCVLPKEIIGEIAELGPCIISDEIYHGLVYGEKEHSILEFTDNAFVLNGFSKYYAMTGWRLGYIISPKQFVRPIQKSQQNLFISPNSISQWAGVTALNQEHPEIAKSVETYNERRIFLISRLREIGFRIPHEPRGAFYILADAKKFSNDSYKFAFDILENTHVAVTPGIDFGNNAEGFIRFSYANSLENIVKACDRLESFLKDYSR
ncbi:MAG: pyridoxal phosphate-dependent aminotransferase, partial [Deltaproteobacteria bacterium]|nr:pyridoxal phosphate-dependent aminotransferase [Deltaproteobacteria bacterium]